MNAFRRMALVAAGLAGVSGLAGAQGKCEINVGSPYQVNSAKIYLGKAASTTGAADEKPKHLQNGIKVLTEKADKIGNPLGRNWLLAKTLFQWTKQEKQPWVTTRGQLGYTENPSQQIDILAAIDTALTAVESANPACTDSTRVYRRVLFATIYTKGVEANNAEQLDSADYYFRRSLVIQPNSPTAYNGLAIIAQKKEDTPAMIAAFNKVVELSGTDTAYAKMRQAAVSNLGVLRVNQAEAATGEERTRLLREAETMFRQFLATNPSDANAQQGLARVLGALGDTAAIAKIYSDMVANPDKFSDLQLFEAGSGALRAKQAKLGAQLLEAGLKKNPYYRDALFNLATAYFDANDADHLGQVATRLVQVDPNNPDNWRLYASQYQLRMKAAQAAKQTAAAKTAQDSLLKYVEKFQNMKVQVLFSNFSHAGARHTLSGSVVNSGSAPVSQSATFEFLDKDGQVVAKKDVALTAPANGSNDFTVEVVQSGIVAFRYQPLK